MEIARHIYQLLAQPQPEPEPLIEAIRLCGPSLRHIAQHLGVGEPMISLWASRLRRLPPSRRAELETLSRNVFLTALEETRKLVLKNPRVVKTEKYSRWLTQLTRVEELLRKAGVELDP